MPKLPPPGGHIPHQDRIRRALRLYNRRARIAAFLDRWMERVAKCLPLCGEGRKHNWSVLFAQMFVTDCLCCFFYRGVSIGVVLSLFLSMLIWGVWHILF